MAVQKPPWAEFPAAMGSYEFRELFGTQPVVWKHANVNSTIAAGKAFLSVYSGSVAEPGAEILNSSEHPAPGLG